MDAAATATAAEGSSASTTPKWPRARELSARLRGYAPVACPGLWLIINLLCLAASLYVLAHILTTGVLDNARRTVALATASYLIWSYLTTLVWIAEIGLSVHYKLTPVGKQEGERTTWRELPWAERIELVLAVIFTFNSLHLLLEWKLEGEDLDEDLLDVVLNILGYSYTTWQILSETGWLMQIQLRFCPCLVRPETEADGYGSMSDDCTNTDKEVV